MKIATENAPKPICIVHDGLETMSGRNVRYPQNERLRFAHKKLRFASF